MENVHDYLTQAWSSLLPSLDKREAILVLADQV
jgi:hypothetical protein